MNRGGFIFARITPTAPAETTPAPGPPSASSWIPRVLRRAVGVKDPPCTVATVSDGCSTITTYTFRLLTAEESTRRCAAIGANNGTGCDDDPPLTCNGCK